MGTRHLQRQRGVGAHEAHPDAQGDLYLVPILQAVGPVADLLAVDVRAILAPQVVQHVAAIVPLDPGVIARNLPFRQHDITIRPPPEGHLGPLDDPALTLQFALVDNKHGHVLSCHGHLLDRMAFLNYDASSRTGEKKRKLDAPAST